MISTNGPKERKPREGQFGIGFGEWKDFVTLFCTLGFCLLSSHIAGRILYQLSHQAAYLGATQNSQEIQISAPYRLCSIQSPMAVVTTLRDPPQVNETFVFPPPSPHQTVNP